MEGKPAEQVDFSLRSFLVYCVISVTLLGLIILPGVFSSTYLRALNTVCLVALGGLVGRTLLGVFFSFREIDKPEVPEELPSVSILVPAYNEESVLEGTIESCADLDYPEDKYEVLICYEDDCTDRTGEIAEEAAEKYGFLRALERSEEGGGKARATNYALERAENEIIGLIDADHQYRPDALKKAVRWFQDDDIWCVKGRCYGRNPESSLITLHATLERHITERIDIPARFIMGGYTFFGGGQAFFDREVFEEIGPFSESTLVEDIDMSTEIQRRGKEIAIDMDVVTFEENPGDLNAWWRQRRRWSRGWMQVAVKHLKGFSSDKTLPFRKRLDGSFTLSYAIVPAFLVTILPLTALTLLGFDTRAFIPYSEYIWSFIAVVPLSLSAIVFAMDRGKYRHMPREYLAAVTIWFYLFFQAVVHISSFIDEFILDKENVFITTTRSE
jgi:cellulose synthase/poly-beta-1,6-N-acetylglucosamine synthase-like glycosyltransferase